MATKEIAGFEVNREVLLKALQRVQSIVDRKNTIPILSHLLIEADGNQLVFSATDLEVGIKCVYPGKISQPGRITVPAKSLYEIVKELPIDSNVKFKVFDNFWVELTAGKSLFKLVGQDSDEFPQLPQVVKEKSFNIPSENFIRMIDHTIFAVSNDQTRYDLSGVFLEQIKAKGKVYLRMVATDGHRLSMMDQEVEGLKDVHIDHGVILPKKGLFELKRVLSEEGSLSCCFMENNIVFWNPQKQTTLFMRLLDGDFPDYTPVIPKNNDRKIQIRRDQLLTSLKRISVLSAEHSRSVRFQFEKGKLCLSSSNPKLGEAKEDIDVDYVGDGIEIGFNAGYFLDVLNAMNQQEEVVLELTDVLSPSLIKGKDFDGSLNIVMPMQLGNETTY
ncbi:MAG: DNA polymerase III subunit beta [Deltaproteobacteria bacterium]|nr:DNA polymerase III subunit beta [Deltaproteobacteria bacterium]